MNSTSPLAQLNPEQLRSLAAQLFQRVEHLEKQVGPSSLSRGALLFTGDFPPA
jgi:hypothetical protein